MSIDPPFLPYGRQTIDEADIAAVADVLRGDFLTTGPAVESYEETFAKAVGAPFAVSCSSGTAGLHLATMALGLGPGDYVIVPTVTFLASANCAIFVGADVAFADVDPLTGLMSVEHAEAAAARVGRDRVKAIVAVHLNGHMVDISGLRKAFPDIPIIEDACHALGGSLLDRTGKMQPVGACADSDIAMFSTHPVKTIASGEGGILTTKNEAIARRMKRFRSHGMIRQVGDFSNLDMALAPDGSVNPWYYEMAEPAPNYRLPDILAALAESQLSKLQGFVEKRRALRDLYVEQLEALSPLARPIQVADRCEPAWHLSVALVDFAAAGTDRATVMKTLREQGVGSQVHYIPVHRQPFYRQRYPNLLLEGAELYYSQCLSLPLFPAMEEADVSRVVTALGQALGAS